MLIYKYIDMRNRGPKAASAVGRNHICTAPPHCHNFCQNLCCKFHYAMLIKSSTTSLDNDVLSKDCHNTVGKMSIQ